MSRIEIDLNVRVRGNGTRAGFEDVAGPIMEGDEVEVFEPESGLVGPGRITGIDNDKRMRRSPRYRNAIWCAIDPAPCDCED
ncbi:hypothetical protein [Streptomyces sp. NPDC057686]|uniref:hypothetical protein n=1 Tax=Streptomyces sp. NPDC057686 TaxID=3346212 RepID=UPI003690F2B1